ncbi:unnamed protein product [Sphacelaria rigidula]
MKGTRARRGAKCRYPWQSVRWQTSNRSFVCHYPSVYAGVKGASGCTYKFCDCAGGVFCCTGPTGRGKHFEWKGFRPIIVLKYSEMRRPFFDQMRKTSGI